MSRRTKRLIEVAILVSIVLLGLAGFFLRQDIYDWYRLRNYDPPTKIVDLADSTTMTDDGRRLFYVSHPQISDKQTFNDKCRAEVSKEFSIILGCYISLDGIYLYNVTDDRLDGVVEVTAAHEMLHVAYERLSDEKKAEIDSLLQSTYKNLDSERIKKTIEQYKEQDPGSVNNELHSILATEVHDLPKALESYYQQYFENRRKIVEFSDKYENTFEGLKNQASQIEAQLTGLKAEIDANQESIGGSLDNLRQEKAELDSLIENGKISEYNSRVDDYNQDVNEYNALVVSTREQIDEYNNLIEQYQKLSVELTNLYQSIDSRPQKL